MKSIALFPTFNCQFTHFEWYIFFIHHSIVHSFPNFFICCLPYVIEIVGCLSLRRASLLEFFFYLILCGSSSLSHSSFYSLSFAMSTIRWCRCCVVVSSYCRYFFSNDLSCIYLAPRFFFVFASSILLAISLALSLSLYFPSFQCLTLFYFRARS